MDHMEKDEEKVWFARYRAAMSVWVCWVGDILRLGDVESVRILKAGGRFLLTGMDVPRLTGHNEHSVTEEAPGYFMIIT